MPRYYLTAAIPYVNGKPHLGHALEFVQGDVIARWHRIKGDEVRYITGSDENSLKVVQMAEKEGISPDALALKYGEAFKDLITGLNISFDAFQRSSAPNNATEAQAMWRACEANGDIYKKTYKGLYCVGCEAFYKKEEFNEKGECPDGHPKDKVQEVEEENYFFKLSKYQAQLKKLIESDEYLILPVSRKNEALGFINQGLEDFSISRSKERAGNWGVPVPGDDSQIMYVWFDALNVYRSAVAPEFWPANLHIIGKGIFRFHAVYWPAMLLSARMALPKELFVHGYVTLNGTKMSKTLGNTVDPMALVKQYGADPIRHYFLREIPADDDGDFSEEKFKIRYNADLANGLGNFASRVLTLAEKFGALSFDYEKETEPAIREAVADAHRAVTAGVSNRKFHEALGELWRLISVGDGYVNAKKPWELTAGSPEQRLALGQLLYVLYTVIILLEPFLPQTSVTLKKYLSYQSGAFTAKKPLTGLFPRL